jgi:hypothetical protein
MQHRLFVKNNMYRHQTAVANWFFFTHPPPAPRHSFYCFNAISNRPMRNDPACIKATCEKKPLQKAKLLSFLLLSLHALLMGYLPAAAQAHAAIGTREATLVHAKKTAIENISQELRQPGAAARFFRHFNGGMQAPAKGWQQRFLLLQQQPQAVLELPVHLLTNSQIKGAYAAFAREGADGRPAIYLNESWLGKYGSVKNLERLFAEELGHALDTYLNQELETPGDEGEGYALAMQYGSIPAAQQARISEENDLGYIVLNNREITVEEAAIYINELYKAAGASYAVQSNSVTNIRRVRGSGFKFTSANPNDPAFSQNSGNNVGGYITCVNNSGTIVRVDGVVSRQNKQGSITEALYFHVTATNEAYWLVMPGHEGTYANSQNPSTSSDPNYWQSSIKHKFN